MSPEDFKNYVFSACQIVATAAVAWGAVKVRKLEANTNSIKDALIKVTGEKAFMDGKEQERMNPERSLAEKDPYYADRAKAIQERK